MLKKIIILAVICLTAVNAVSYASTGILVQGAMPSEVSLLVEKLSDAKEVNIDGWKFWQGKIGSKKVIVSETKVGTTNAAAATVLGLQKFKPALIINQGTSGAFTAATHINDIIIVDKTYNMSAVKADVRLAGENLDINGWKLRDDGLQQLEFSSDKSLVALAQQVGKKYTAGKVFTGALASADRWTQEIDYMTYWYGYKGIMAEEMESAAASQVAAAYNVPILNIRVISANPINNEEFTMEGSDSSAANCQLFTIDIIKVLPN